MSDELTEAGAHEAVVTDAAVIISELFSNALRHAYPLPSGDVRVGWGNEGEAILLAVSDGGAPTQPRRERGTLSSLGGRGLGIVDTIADRWGVRRDSLGTTVWATLRVPETVRADIMGAPDGSAI